MAAAHPIVSAATMGYVVFDMYKSAPVRFKGKSWLQMLET